MLMPASGFGRAAARAAAVVICLGLIVALAAPGLPAAANPAPPRHVCDASVQVNTSAFGLGGGSDGNFGYEEGFEVASFNGRLYVGMEADNAFGARLWRTAAGVDIARSQADWEEVAADAAGRPFGLADFTGADHIDSLAAFNGYLYASTAVRGSSLVGMRLFRSPSGAPGSWEDALAATGPGFGIIYNMNFKDMVEFQGWLCGGTQNWNNGAQVYCTQDGLNWVQKNFGGFGPGWEDMNVVEVWSAQVFDGALYMGTQDVHYDFASPTDDVARLYRTTDINAAEPAWELVYGGQPGSRRAILLGELNGYLYIMVESPAGVRVLRSPSGDAATWAQVSPDGMNGSAANAMIPNDGALVYNGALYAAVSNTSGFQLWRTTGALAGGGPYLDWELAGPAGLGDPANQHAQLADFNGYLYSWTSNYATGQQVRSAECGLEQTLSITQAGVAYDFDPALRASAVFHQIGSLTQLTVRAYPGAWDAQGLLANGIRPVKRHYQLSSDGAGFSARLSLAYTDDEFIQSDISDENTTYQAFWDGLAWNHCPAGQQQRDPVANTVICDNVASFDRVEISGSAEAPTVVTFTSLQARPAASGLPWGLLAAAFGLALAVLARRRQ